MRRDEWTDPYCPVARTLDIVGDRWSLLIVRDAFDGARRFGDFERNLGIAKNILSDRLRSLVAKGVLAQERSGARPEYVLTDAGRDLFTVVVGLRQWGERHAFDPGEVHSELIDSSSGKPIAELRVRDRSGVVVDPEGARVRKVHPD